MNKGEAEELIENIPGIETVWIKEEKPESRCTRMQFVPMTVRAL